MADEMKREKSGKAGAWLQRLGRSLSGMVMPNIGAFIAWGLITALFIPSGWIPDAQIARLVEPMLFYLLPLLIGQAGGRATGGSRGGVVGAAATMGLVVGADVPMFLGAMLIGPLAGYLTRRMDSFMAERTAPGFEMLVSNFSAGIIGAVFAVAAYKGIGPLVYLLNEALKHGADQIMQWGVLPLAAIIIEPGKVLFLNNALNHGLLGPIGMQETAVSGKSILFLLETNPGPGIGLLVAYWVAAQGAARQSAPGALLIHALGGIHEIYFPYVLMNPLLLLPLIISSGIGIAVFGELNAGLVATPSPGSLLTVLAMTPKGSYAAVLAGIGISAVLSFLLAMPLIRRSADENTPPLDAEEQIKRVLPVGEIILACDAGLGSSAMAASILRRKLAQAGYAVDVAHCAVDEIPPSAGVVITHAGLAERVRQTALQAKCIAVDDLIVNDAFETLLAGGYLAAAECSPEVEKEVEDDMILLKSNIHLGLASVDKAAAVQMAGELLHASGYVKEGYIAGMQAREAQLSTYIGKGVAIPHGIGAAKEEILRSGMVVLQFPDGVLFDGELAYLVIGIAGIGNEHLSILANIATVLGEEEGFEIETLWRTQDADMIHELFTLNRETE